MICGNFKAVIIGSNWCFEGNKNWEKNVPRNAINIVTIYFQLQKDIFD